LYSIEIAWLCSRRKNLGRTAAVGGAPADILGG
jgi:hypothetical protein